MGCSRILCFEVAQSSGIANAKMDWMHGRLHCVEIADRGHDAKREARIQRSRDSAKILVIQVATALVLRRRPKPYPAMNSPEDFPLLTALREKVQQLAQEGHKRIVLNMASVKTIDSAGLGELIAAHSKFTAIGGNVKLSNITKPVDELLTVTKLYKVFQAFEDESEAVSSFWEKKTAA